ncbi:MAG: glycerol dehydrogenase [Burkholderiaceae bacterium]
MLRTFGSPHRYMQGPGALRELGTLARSYGSRVLVIADAVVSQLLSLPVAAAFEGSDAQLQFAEFSGECTAAEIERLTAVACASNADVVVGLGGGKAIDTAKGVCVEHRKPLIVVPTIASNDSPTSRLVVVYTDTHQLHEVRKLRANPDVVLVDTAILIQAPERFFVSGIGDALSKKFEAAQCVATGNLNFYAAHPPFIAQVIADACYETIRTSAEAALEALRRRTVDEAFERTVEATILLSGLAFENGGLSMAHSLTRGFSAVPETASALHGEQVAFGLLVQLVLEGRPRDFIDELRRFYALIGLPRSLNDLGLKGDPAAAATVIARDTWARAPYVKALSGGVDAARIEAALITVHHWIDR